MNDSREFKRNISIDQNRKCSSSAERNLRFWGRMALEAAGIILIVAAGLFLFYSLGNMDISSRQGIKEGLAVFPYYLYLGGVFSIMMLTIGYFQVYFSLLVSMNNKRKTVAAGIWASTLLLILLVNAGAWLIWKVLHTDLAVISIKLIPVFTGACFLTGAFSLVLGVVIVRWGKIGTILLTAVCMIVGGLVGAGVIGIEGAFEFLTELAEQKLWIVPAAGLILYGLSGIFAMAAVRKVEIRS